MTAEVIRKINGKEYYVTGNYGFIDLEGYFTMIGRSSRFYIISTLNKVYCEHVQRIISNIDVVDHCAVVPKPDPKMLFTGATYVVLKDGIGATEKTAEYIIDKCKMPVKNIMTGKADELQPYEVPTHIYFMHDLPLTRAGKVDYRALEKLAAEAGS